MTIHGSTGLKWIEMPNEQETNQDRSQYLGAHPSMLQDDMHESDAVLSFGIRDMGASAYDADSVHGAHHMPMPQQEPISTQQGSPVPQHAPVQQRGQMQQGVSAWQYMPVTQQAPGEQNAPIAQHAASQQHAPMPKHAANPIFGMQSAYLEEVGARPAEDEFARFDAQEAGDGSAPMIAGDAFEATPQSAVLSASRTKQAFKAAFPPLADKPKNNVFLTVVFLVAVALYAAWDIFGTAYDNDIWFIMATGEEIVKNGIPYTNPFSLHEGMGIVVQQWLSCVISYLIYGAGGFVGLGIWTLFLFAILVFSFYRVSRMIRDDSYGSEMIMLVFLPLVPILSTYASVRPHLYTMIAFVWIVGLLTAYRRTSKLAYIVPLPFIVALHVNFHASMAPFDIVIMVCYLIPDLLKPLHERGYLLKIGCIEWDYKRIPLLIVTVASILALLANPYFIDGALYVVRSLGTASYRDYISEMNPLVPASHWIYIMVSLFVIVTAISLGAQGSKRINFPLLLLVVGTSALSFTQIRNLWLGPLFCAFYLVSIGAHHSILLFARAKAAKILSWAVAALGAIGCCLLIAFEAPALQAQPENDSSTPVAAIDYLDEIGADKDKTRILNFFNSGGYFEYRGYKVVMDPRPELWAPSITGLSFNYYEEFVDMTMGDTYIDDYIAKYDLNVYVVDKTDASVDIFKDQEVYLEISGGSDYRAFIKRDAYEYITGKDISTAPTPVRHESKRSGN